MPRVTALRAAGARVQVELDGAPWRSVPVEAAAEARLALGVELDRERARDLARALRRRRAEEVALRALARRDHSRASLERRLARVSVSASERRDVVDRATRAGLVDDARFAGARARVLCDRGAGDLMVLEDLARNGIDEDLARAAVARLDPEPERASRIVERRGGGIRTIRYLASRGFSEETLEPLVAEVESRAVP